MGERCVRSVDVVEPERIEHLVGASPRRGRYVLYWMQAAVRAECNPALEVAVQTANELEQPLLVCFGLTDKYPQANARHFQFLLEGLQAAGSGLERRGIKLVVRRGDPAQVAKGLATHACSVVVDRGYLRHQRSWRRTLARQVDVPLVEVDANLVVPVHVASSKREYAARTFRPRIRRHLNRYLQPLRTTALDRPSLGMKIPGLVLDDALAMAGTLGSLEVGPTGRFSGGTFQARAVLRRFLDEKLQNFASEGSQPHREQVSYLSMYLHFGHISPVYAALAARDSNAPESDVDAFLEQLVVRRELAHNFVWYESDYDKYSALPNWARETLRAHRDDKRTHVYTRKELEAAATHDRYWNAAMVEMRETGYLHNHLRMYWGKKILEWTNTPQFGYRTTLELNNKYLLDGRDPASYANVAWVYGLHDQAWKEREIFGKVRYMSAAGLERKIDVEAYVAGVESRTGVKIHGKD